MGRSSVLALLLWAAAGWAMAADVVYVHSQRAKLLQEPRFAAEVVTVARRGASLTVLEEQSRWVRVRAAEEEGWVPALVVKDHPPLQKVTVLDAEAEAVQQGARRRASAASAAGATRGLMADSRHRSISSEADYEALQEVEALRIPQDEVADFLHYLQRP